MQNSGYTRERSIVGFYMPRGRQETPAGNAPLRMLDKAAFRPVHTHVVQHVWRMRLACVFGVNVQPRLLPTNLILS